MFRLPCKERGSRDGTRLEFAYTRHDCHTPVVWNAASTEEVRSAKALNLFISEVVWRNTLRFSSASLWRPVCHSKGDADCWVGLPFILSAHQRMNHILWQRLCTDGHSEKHKNQDRVGQSKHTIVPQKKNSERGHRIVLKAEIFSGQLDYDNNSISIVRVTATSTELLSVI